MYYLLLIYPLCDLSRRHKTKSDKTNKSRNLYINVYILYIYHQCAKKTTSDRKEGDKINEK